MQHRQSQRNRGGPASEQPQEMYPLPRDTSALARLYANQCHNYGLRLERLLEYGAGMEELATQAKERYTKNVNGRKLLNFSQQQQLLSAQKRRWKAMLDNCHYCGYVVKSFQLRAVGRVVIGLGAESVLETSIRLHRIYGFPFIPGSALKGLARSYAELVEGKDETDEIFAAVFGESPPDARAGQVIFLDAVPADSVSLQLELDVMNPHYSEYYQGTSPPADYLNPIPVFFLTIAPDSQFLFAVLSKKSELTQQAQEWLQAGLKKMGVGAKTTAGYGLWESQHQTMTTASEGIQEALSEPVKKPEAPEPIERITSKTERIPAQVLDNSRNPIQVRLLVKGYENEVFECYGVRNLSSFPPGTYIWVNISEIDKKTRYIRKVSLAGLWRP